MSGELHGLTANDKQMVRMAAKKCLDFIAKQLSGPRLVKSSYAGVDKMRGITPDNKIIDHCIVYADSSTDEARVVCITNDINMLATMQFAQQGRRQLYRMEGVDFENEVDSLLRERD